MYRLMVVPTMLLIATVTPSSLSAADTKDVLAPGKPIPATFHPFNVNVAITPTDTNVKEIARSVLPPYSSRNKFHCLISEYDLDPTIMLLAKGSLEDNAALKDLLQKLDGVIERNRRYVRLRAFVVFLQDDIKNLIIEDEKRMAAAGRLERLAEDLKLRNVVVALASPADVAKYQLDDNVALAAILYRKLKIEAAHLLTADKLDAANSPAIKAILSDVASKFGANR